MYYSTSLQSPVIYEKNSMNHLFLLTLMLPLDFFYISEIWFLKLKYSIESKMKKQNNIFSINSPNLITNLAHVNYAVFEKMSTIIHDKKSIALIYSKNGYIYEFHDYPNFLEKFFENNLIDKNSLQTAVFDEKQRNKIISPEIVNCKEIFDHYQLNNCDFFHSLLQAFVLCSTKKPEYSSKTQKKKMKFRTTDSKLLYKFAKFLEYEYIRTYKKDNQLVTALRVRKRVDIYKILGFFEEETQMEYSTYSIIYEDPNEKKVFICCRGHLSKIIQKLVLSVEDKEFFEKVISIFHKKGFLDPLTFARRALTEQETEHFMETYKNLQSSLINQDDYLSELINSLLFDLEVVAIVGIEEDIDPDIYNLINFFKTLRINSWLLTGDSKINAYNIASRIGIFDDLATQYCIDSENYEELVKQIKRILVNLSKQIKPLENNGDKKSKKSMQLPLSSNISPVHRVKSKTINLNTIVDEYSELYLVINGRSFNCIIQDEYLYCNFLFILSILRTIIGYNFSPENKRKLIEIIKTKLSNNPTVLAIGHGYNDIMMMSAANISVELANIHKSERKIMIGDIVTSNLKQIKELLVKHSGKYFDKYYRFIQISYYKSFILGFSLFLYAFFDNFYSNCIYDPILSFFYVGIFTLVGQAISLISYRKIPRKIRKNIVEIYYEGKYQTKKKKIRKTLFLLLLEAFIISVVISIISLYIQKDAVNQDGITSNYHNISLIYAYSFSIFFHFKVKQFFIFY